MERPRVFRFLRIAVTALSLTACVLLIVLWVRSYWSADALNGFKSFDGTSFASTLSLISECGIIKVGAKRWRETERWEYNRYKPDPKEPFRGVLGFYYGPPHPTFERSRMLTLPIWLFVIPAAVIAILPWIHWSKRFSLRTLLIATTLVAVGLGVFAAFR